MLTSVGSNTKEVKEKKSHKETFHFYLLADFANVKISRNLNYFGTLFPYHYFLDRYSSSVIMFLDHLHTKPVHNCILD